MTNRRIYGPKPGCGYLAPGTLSRHDVGDQSEHRDVLVASPGSKVPVSRRSLGTDLKESNLRNIKKVLRLSSAVTDRGAVGSSLWGALQGHPWLARVADVLSAHVPRGNYPHLRLGLLILARRAKHITLRVKE